MSDQGPQPAEFPDRGPAVFAVTTATLVLATVVVAGRMVSRIGIVRRTGWDDYIMVLAWLIAVFLSLGIDMGTRLGLGRQDRDIDPADRPGLRMCEYVFSILYNPALMATKTSVLVFYLRLFKNTEQVLRLASWAVLGVVNVAGAILTLMNIFQCTPIRAAWDINVRPDRCIPLLTEFICSAPVNVTTDLAILALPIPVLTSMRLPPRQKTILVLTFALGIFVTVVDVVRIYYLQHAIAFTPTTPSSDFKAIFGQSADFSWNASLSLMWSAVEVNVGIACACVPTLKPLIIRVLPAMLVGPDGTTLRASTTAPTGSTANSAKPPDGSTTDERRHSSVGAMPPGPSANMGMGTSTLQPPALSVTPPDDEPGDAEISLRDFLAGSPSNPAQTNRTSSCHQQQRPPSLLLLPPNANPNPFNGRNSSSSFSTITTTAAAAPPGGGTAVYFGFVNLRRPKSMLATSARDSLRYCAVVSVLFFLWGFSYGLLNTLNNAVAAVADMSVPQTLGLTSVYFGAGYLLGPLLVGEWLLRHDEHHRRLRGGAKKKGEKAAGKVREKAKRGDVVDGRGVAGAESVGGFKATFIAGLLIYGTGTIMFWPGAVLVSYAGFMASTFVVGFGLAVLETAANPFLVLCGPPRYADARLLLAQAVQAVGSVLSGLLATRVFFPRLERSSGGGWRTVDSTTLIDVQWAYLAVTLLSVLLALFFYYMPLPEASDAELAELAGRLPVDPKQKSVGGVSLRTWSIALAVFSQWTYVSAQENVSLFFDRILASFTPTNDPSTLALSPQNYLLVAHATFALSRFLAALLCYLHASSPASSTGRRSVMRRLLLPAPRTLLGICIGLSTLSSLLVVLLPAPSSPSPSPPPSSTTPPSPPPSPSSSSSLFPDLPPVTGVTRRANPPPTTAAGAAAPTAAPDLLTLPLLLLLLAEGPIWPLVFSLGLRGQGARTKRAAAWLTMAGCGPAFWPFVAWAVLRDGGDGERTRVAMVVVVALVAAGGVFPAWLGASRAARGLVDLDRGEERRDGGLEMEEGGRGRSGGGGGGGGDDRRIDEDRDAGVGDGDGDDDERRRQDEIPPWERQVLDTTILRD